MKKKNLKDRVYEAIMEDIYSGVYKPGDIINEKNLVEKYACSKSPVREALIALCENQVLRNIPRYGYEVTKLTKEDIREMLEFRYYLEGGILYARMGKITPQQIRELEQLNQECLRDDLSPREHWMANLAFHVALIHACGNEYIDQQIQTLHAAAYPGLRPVPVGRGQAESASFQRLPPSQTDSGRSVEKGQFPYRRPVKAGSGRFHPAGLNLRKEERRGEIILHSALNSPA